MRLTALLTSLTFLSFSLLPPAACAQLQLVQRLPPTAGAHAVTSTSADWTMAYDAENRLVEVKTAPEETVSVTFQPGWNFFALPVIPEDGAVVVLLPSFAQDFEQIAKFEPATNTFTHYVGNPKFDDLTELEYGVGYQVYCKASAPVTVSIKGRLPSATLSKALSPGWHLVGSTVLADTPLATWLNGVSYAEVREHNSTDNSLPAATQAKPNNAYWVRVSALSTCVEFRCHKPIP